MLHLAFNGLVSRNQYRNQIDYIVTKRIICHKPFVQDSRSYSGITTLSDHKLVKCNLKLDWWKIKKTFKNVNRINVDKLKEPSARNEYVTELSKNLCVNKKKLRHQMKPGHELPANVMKQRKTFLETKR